ncbi:MAG: type II restriction enzyme [Candidatus Dojkabacteria bacterium]
MSARDKAWEKIFKDYNIEKHNFDKEPFFISSNEIKKSCKDFVEGGITEPRILCKQDSRESRPQVFKDNNLFILPTKNKHYAILKGEGYVDIPDIVTEPKIHKSKLEFDLETTKVGNSEMQHLDHAYASSIIRTFAQDPTLVLTIRGRKYTPEFSFKVNNYEIITQSVQTEVDAGYEGKDSVILVEAKNSRTSNEIIRQLYYPFRQWSENTTKNVTTLFFEKRGDLYYLWQFAFLEPYEYNSIKLIKSERYRIE